MRIAVVTMGVKLPSEVRGYTRFRFLSELLVREGFEVELFTSSFQHWEKAQRNTAANAYKNLPYALTFIQEPGYKKNLDMARIASHHVAAKNLRALFKERFTQNTHAYDLIYAEIPPNNVARVCAEVAHEHNIPFIADVNDLWPEAMRMVVNIPLISDVAFYPFTRDARRVYQLLSGAVGTSDEYALRPAADRTEPYPHVTVYVGNNLADFDEGAKTYAPTIHKPADEFWVTYAGTLGASYGLETLVDAACEAGRALSELRVKILGDGPERAHLEAYAKDRLAPVDFLGYVPYEQMAAWLCASDASVNSLAPGAAQSIVTKIGDYLAAGIPLINTGESAEFRTKVASDELGINVNPGDVHALAGAVVALAQDQGAAQNMGAHARVVAEREFDQEQSYRAIVELILSLCKNNGEEKAGETTGSSGGAQRGQEG